jgi:hypothetical protein
MQAHRASIGPLNLAKRRLDAGWRHRGVVRGLPVVGRMKA